MIPYRTVLYLYLHGAVVVMIVWWLDLQLPMQSVPNYTNVVSSNLVHGEVYSIQYYPIMDYSQGNRSPIVLFG